LTLDITDYVFLLACILMETALLVFLVRSRIFRTLPIFTSFIGWNLCSDLAIGIVMSLWPERYLWFFLLEFPIDAIYQFRILAELARSVRRHNRARSPRRIILALLVPMAAALVWQMVAWTAPANCTIMGKILVHLMQTAAVLRAGFVLALVLWSTLLGLRWPDRELRIITGFGFYTIVALAVSILHTHQTLGPMYHFLDQAMSASYICALFYWIYSFAPNDPKPQSSLSRNSLIASRIARNRKYRPCTVVELQSIPTPGSRGSIDDGGSRGLQTPENLARSGGLQPRAYSFRGIDLPFRREHGSSLAAAS